MTAALKKEIGQLKNMSVNQLQSKYGEVYGERTNSRHKDFLFKRIAWRIQANAMGGLSERALRRAAELVNESDLRQRMPASPPETPERTIHAPFRPKAPTIPVGTLLVKVYRGRRLEVMVREDGYEFEGTIFQSLSAIANHITGTRWNGKLFFGVAQ